MMLAVLAVVGVAPTTAAPATIVPVQTVDQSFETAGPFVRCSWLLPDADERPSNGVQYLEDDITEAAPLRGGCALSGPIVVSGNRHLIQVHANPGDLPGRRTVELWSAVEHIDGVSGVDGVFFRVFYPDGTFKVEAQARLVDSGTCASLGSAGSGVQDTTMFGAAVATSQMDAAVAASLASRCSARALGLYRALIDLGYTEPCGEYRMEVHAGDGTGDRMVTVNYFDVECVQQATPSISRVSWGALTPGSSKWLFGASKMDSPDAPTLTNRGSSGIEIGLRFAPMKLIEGSGPQITEFGAALAIDGRRQVIDVIEAGTDVWFGDDGIICAGETAVFDAAVHAPADLAQGPYSGNIRLLTRPANGTCNNNLGIYGGQSLVNQRTPSGASAGPAPTAPLLPSGVEAATTTSTSTTIATGTTAAAGSTTTTSPVATTTTTSVTTTTVADPAAGYPIPFLTVTAVYTAGAISGYDWTATIQPGFSVPGDQFDLDVCWPLVHILSGGKNAGDTNRNSVMNAGEGWVFSCGFGTEPAGNPTVPFTPSDLLGQ